MKEEEGDGVTAFSELDKISSRESRKSGLYVREGKAH